MPSTFLRTRPELLNPVHLPHEPRRQDPVRELCSRYLERNHVPYLVPFLRLGLKVLRPLAQRPPWDVGLGCNICNESAE